MAINPGLNANLTLIFVDYTMTDTGVVLHFQVSSDTPPGGGQLTDYFVGLLDADITGAANVPALAATVKAKLQRQLRATTLSTKLDALIGQSITGV